MTRPLSEMVPFNLLSQDDQKEMLHDFLGHIMPLAPASTSCDTTDTMIATTALFNQDNQSDV